MLNERLDPAEAELPTAPPKRARTIITAEPLTRSGLPTTPPRRRTVTAASATAIRWS